ncbi:exodeoxyribonuclease III [Endozoicomonas sp. SCSIO W0465]|uniref:exodeoxyribonuclease III n=1 Tax=Endozoicomonas sp. SCSIO W0465 TaxID=2918516 RepID=UPI00207619DD|nr:exodeoxyribonuclease III [Endozoicomonas sp. SCSIO W0465]USE39462.1 exodeoxyribonuclease III [Endozoicomonas sp. SCSIO W0465]
MKIVSFNVNGLRARLHQLSQVIDYYSPDLIGLQEIKVSDEQFPVKAIESMGYNVLFHGQKTHYGVALLSKTPALNVQKGFPAAPSEAQRRLIIGDYELNGHMLRVINGYFPQGENRSHLTKFADKEKFYNDLQRYLHNSCSPLSNILVIGDFNISHTDLDIGIGPDNARRWLRTGKCSFLPEERVWFDRLLDWGLTDCFRVLYPTEDRRFSWFDYRSRGFESDPKRGLRIDGVLATAPLMQACHSVTIDYDIRAMEKPSDHAPVIAEFSLDK